jgi:hypothetical protein
MLWEMRGFADKLELTEADFEACAAGPTVRGPGHFRAHAIKRKLVGWAESVRVALSAEHIDLQVSATDDSVRFSNEGSSAHVELGIQATGVVLTVSVPQEMTSALVNPQAEVERAFSSAHKALQHVSMHALDGSRSRRPAFGGSVDAEASVIIGTRIARADALVPRALDGLHDVALAFGRLLQVLASMPRSRRRTPAARPEAKPRTASPIDRGTHVRALAGPFAGQAGVVQELDGKGAARVLFGLLAARVALQDLAVHDAKRGRPRMTSSHRKPTS